MMTMVLKDERPREVKVTTGAEALRRGEEGAEKHMGTETLNPLRPNCLTNRYIVPGKIERLTRPLIRNVRLLRRSRLGRCGQP